MSTDEELELLGAKLTSQKNQIRQLKKDGAESTVVQEAVAQMKALEAALTSMQLVDSGPAFDRESLENTLLRRMVYVPSFEIHGGTGGFYDFGPIGCALKEAIQNIWRRHFVVQERMLQVEATCLTAESVLKASGHVERFTDLMVKDAQTGQCYRADKLLEDHIENLVTKTPGMPKVEREDLERIARQADAYTPTELGDLLNRRFEIKAPDTGNVLSEPFPFNLMFQTSIGPEGHSKGYLRPETAQGIFVNFKRLLDYNSGKMPFAAAQLGLGFRNEISPRAGLIRCREFQMAEIEHFVHPDEKDHPKFPQVAGVELSLFSSDNQLTTGKVEKVTAGDAVAAGMISNETLAYFMVRTQLFCEKLGIDMERVRFRQHLPSEMAHYATDCWDLEIKLSYGWVECAGHADRACYDLKVHSEFTNNDLKASRSVIPPREEAFAAINADKKLMGKEFKKASAAVGAYLESLSLEEACSLGDQLTAGSDAHVIVDGVSYKITPPMLTITKSTRLIHEERFYPSVIEPSFGIGRILYAVLEHTFYHREEEIQVKKGDVQRVVFKFNPLLAPIKCGVCSLLKKPEQEKIASEISDLLVEKDLFSTCDISGASIGKKYSRLDELGAPFCITVDPGSMEGKGFTLRERDSQQQIRVVEVETLIQLVADLCELKSTWETVVQKYGLDTGN